MEVDSGHTQRAGHKSGDQGQAHGWQRVKRGPAGVHATQWALARRCLESCADWHAFRRTGEGRMEPRRDPVSSIAPGMDTAAPRTSFGSPLSRVKSGAGGDGAGARFPGSACSLRRERRQAHCEFLVASLAYRSSNLRNHHFKNTKGSRWPQIAICYTLGSIAARQPSHSAFLWFLTTPPNQARWRLSTKVVSVALLTVLPTNCKYNTVYRVLGT